MASHVDVNVDVFVNVDVDDPVIVAALGNGNVTLIVIERRGRAGIDQRGQHSHLRSSNSHAMCEGEEVDRAVCVRRASGCGAFEVSAAAVRRLRIEGWVLLARPRRSITITIAFPFTSAATITGSLTSTSTSTSTTDVHVHGS